MANKVIRWPGSFDEEGRPDAAEIHAAEAGSEQVPAWFDMNAALRGLPEGLHGGLLAMLGEVFAETDLSPSDDRTPEWMDELRDEDLWCLVKACRAGLTGPVGPTASGSAFGTNHRNLDSVTRSVVRAHARRDALAHRRLLGEVSHDLRSPLNSILFLADALRNEQSGPLNEVQARQVSVLFTAAVTLVKMVNDLIDFAQLEENRTIRVACVSFSVQHVLQDVESLVRPLASHRQAEFLTHISIEGPRTGDSQLLVRVLLNLATNAVQSVEDAGKVTIEVDETPEGWLCVKVTDNAVGTDVESLRSRIESAGRVPTQAETRGWTHGLGLAISAQLVGAAGGSMFVETVPGEGTVFTVILPFLGL